MTPPREGYTIDDVVEACIKAELGDQLADPPRVSALRFYLHMAYALGMGLQPTPLYARLAELDRVKEIRIG